MSVQVSLRKASRALWLGLAFLFSAGLAAHPMPNSLLLLDLLSDRVRAELYLPLPELRMAVADSAATENPDWLRGYLVQHIAAGSPDGTPWRVTIGTIRRAVGEQQLTGTYAEYVVALEFIPPPGYAVGVFDLYYDAIVHQLVTHKTLVRMRDGAGDQVGVIGLDVVHSVAPPPCASTCGGRTP